MSVGVRGIEPSFSIVGAYAILFDTNFFSYHAGWFPKVKKAVPVSDRVLRSQVVKHKFRGLTVTPLNGLDFD